MGSVRTLHDSLNRSPVESAVSNWQNHDCEKGQWHIQWDATLKVKNKNKNPTSFDSSLFRFENQQKMV